MAAKYSRLTTFHEDVSPVQRQSARRISQTLFPSCTLEARITSNPSSRPALPQFLSSLLALPLRITSAPRRPRFWPPTRRRTRRRQHKSTRSALCTNHIAWCQLPFRQATPDPPPILFIPSHSLLTPRRPRRRSKPSKSHTHRKSSPVQQSTPHQLEVPNQPSVSLVVVFSLHTLPSPSPRPRCPKSQVPPLPGRHESKQPRPITVSASLASKTHRCFDGPATATVTASPQTRSLQRQAQSSHLSPSPLHKRKQASKHNKVAAHCRTVQQPTPHLTLTSTDLPNPQSPSQAPSSANPHSTGCYIGLT